MDPCSFVRIIVGNLAVSFPESPWSSSSSGPSVSDASSGNCYCKIKFKSFSPHIVDVPVLLQTESESDSRCFSDDVFTIAACFNLRKSQIETSLKKPKWSVLSVEVCSHVDTSCGFIASSAEKLIGRFEVLLDLKAAEAGTCLIENKWVVLGTKSNKKKFGLDPQLHVSVRVESNPRFVFQFGGEPECSPQVFQVQGNTQQAVFTCKFGFRNLGDRNLSPIVLSLTSGNEQLSKQRKGWSITIHDLSGSPVAMASMVTPFVPSPGSNRVTRTNPGAWLILRPDGCTWKPWGRLEAWREPGFSDILGYRFKRFQDGIAIAVSASSSISTKLGGSFNLSSQVQQNLGFVMSTTVEGVEKHSKPKVEVGVKYVTCAEDAAAHVALAAAVDLSMDACKLFSKKLRKELSRVAVV